MREPVYVEPVCGAQVDPSKVWLCKTAFQGQDFATGLADSKTPGTCSGANTVKKKNKRELHSSELTEELVSDPSTYVKKRTQGQDGPILLRHMG